MTLFSLFKNVDEMASLTPEKHCYGYITRLCILVQDYFEIRENPSSDPESGDTSHFFKVFSPFPAKNLQPYAVIINALPPAKEGSTKKLILQVGHHAISICRVQDHVNNRSRGELRDGHVAVGGDDAGVHVRGS